MLGFTSSQSHQHQLLTALKEALAFCVSSKNDFSLPLETIFEALLTIAKGDKASRAASAECLGLLMLLNRQKTLDAFKYMMGDGADKINLTTVKL